MTIKRALVTGANGFIGSNLCRHLRAANIPVRALVLPGEDVSRLIADGVEVVRGDIAGSMPEHLCADVSHVFHLAAIASDWGPVSLFDRVNRQGTENILAAAVTARVPRFVHMSSLAVHAYRGHTAGTEETLCDSMINAYAISKRQAESAVLTASPVMHTTIIRPGVVPYGVGDQRTIPGLVDALRRGIYRHIGSGNQRVCLSQADNLAEGMLLAAQRAGPSGEIYILSDDIVTWREFMDTLAEVFELSPARGSLPLWLAGAAAHGLEALYHILPLRGEPPLTRYRVSLFRGDLVFLADKARRELGYVPKIHLREGLEQVRKAQQTGARI